MKTAHFRFYAELRDLISGGDRDLERDYRFRGRPTVKDAIEAQGVPHTEVDLVLINGEVASFDRHLSHADRVSVYPVFESLDLSPIQKLRGSPLRRTAFVLDVHLGKLARLLRLVGLDCSYRNDSTDDEIIEVGEREGRIVLTRDRGILKNKRVTHGYCVRSDAPKEQACEVIRRFQLDGSLAPFTRCMACNGAIAGSEKSVVADRLPGEVGDRYDEFRVCTRCGKAYWKGSHHQVLRRIIREIGGDPDFDRTG